METHPHNFDDLLREALRRREDGLPQLSADFTERLVQRVEAERKPRLALVQRGWGRWLAVAAVLAVAFLLGMSIADHTLVELRDKSQANSHPVPQSIRPGERPASTIFQTLHDTIFIDRPITRSQTLVRLETIYIQLPPDASPTALRLDESFLQLEDMERTMRDFMTERGDTLLS
ncbi:MAG: hypothetical protein IJV06_10305 [Bacteroidaceae bacterium]|nr:hypothetical protein [Bacteroidaceae bacterium]